MTFGRFVNRLQLPQHLPPSFKGVAARYIYTLDACLTYAQPIPTSSQPAADVAAGPTPSSAPPSQDNGSLAPRDSQSHAESHEVAGSALHSSHGVPPSQPSSDQPSRLGFLGRPRSSASGTALANGHSRISGPALAGKDPRLRGLKEVAVRLPITIWPPPVSFSFLSTALSSPPNPPFSPGTSSADVSILCR